jgi:hypothetical protein
MNNLRQHTEQLREATKLLALITSTDDTEILRQIAAHAALRQIKDARSQLTKPRVRT